MIVSVLFNDGLHSLRPSTLLKLAAMPCDEKPFYPLNGGKSFKNRGWSCSRPLIELCGILNDNALVFSVNQAQRIIIQEDK